MLLNGLSDGEKKKFAELCWHAAKANGVVVDEETAIVESYCDEMNIEVPESNAIASLEEIAQYFSESSLQVKKIVLFEAIGLLKADGIVDTEELQFINEYSNRIGLTEDDVNQSIEMLDKYMNVCQEIVDLVCR